VVTLADPLYCEEYVDGAVDVMSRFLIPALFAAEHLDGGAVASILAPFKGHRMAKAALEMAVLDAELKAEGRPLARELGAVHDRVPCGVSVGIMDSVPALLAAVHSYLEQGYQRIKLKIEPGWDVEPVRAVRASSASTPSTCCSSSSPSKRTTSSATPSWPQQLRTPMCLDESITSARTAAAAISLGACSVVNIKPGRVGGYLEARRIHDLCVAHGVAVWCGGMLETGIGRAANVALAALPGFTLPGDTSASDRYCRTDITEPFVLADGHLQVPTGAGIGVEPLPDELEAVTTWTQWLPA